MKKRFLAIFLAMAMFISLLPASVSAGNLNTIRVIIENTVLSQEDGAPWAGTLIDETVQVTSGSTMMDALKEVLKDIPDVKYTSDYISSIKGLKAADMSGWMGTLNDWFTNKTFNNVSVENGDTIRLMYTQDGGSDIGGIYNSRDKHLSNITTNSGSLSPDFNAQTKNYTLTVPEGTTSIILTPTAKNKYYQVRTALQGTTYKPSAAIPVIEDSIITVTCGDPSWPTMVSGSETVPAEIYTITVRTAKTVSDYGLSFGVSPDGGGTINIDIEAYDYYYDELSDDFVWDQIPELTQSLTEKTEYSIRLMKYEKALTEFSAVPVAASGYKYKGWKKIDSSDLLKEGDSFTINGYTGIIDKDTHKLTILNYNTDNQTHLISSKDIEITAVFEKSATPQEMLDSLLKKLSFYKIKPDFSKDSNVLTILNAEIKKQDPELYELGITTSLKKTADPDYVASDGKITYMNPYTFDFSGMSTIYQKNVVLTFELALDNSKVNLETTAMIGWDIDKLTEKIQKEEVDKVTEDMIKNQNSDLQNVTSDLVLPQIMGSTYKASLSQIKWSSDNTSVIQIKNGDGYTYPPYIGVITKPVKDTVVTLTATFTCNKNSSFETPTVLTKQFKVMVKGPSADDLEKTRKDMQEELDSKYLTEKLLVFETKGQLNIENVKSDIQLPNPSKIGLVYKEIKVTSSDESLVTVNGLKVNVVQPFNKDRQVDLIITMTRDNISVTKIIPLTIKAVSEDEIDAEIKLMEKAKASFFEGINDLANEDKDNITKNLHAFHEVNFDSDGKTLLWSYSIATNKDTGIYSATINPDDVMGELGYNDFSSSNPNIIRHDNLLVNRPDEDTQVTVKSVLSSRKYEKYAVAYPDNEKLQKLYRQPVEVTVTVKGKNSLTDGETAQKVIEEITALGTPDTLTLDMAQALRAADENYMKLTQKQKGLVTNFQTLSDLKAKMIQLEKDAAEQQLTKLKADAKSGLESYKDNSQYRDPQKSELAAAIDAGKKAIDSAADADSISKAAAAAKTAIDSIKTDAQLSLEELNAAKSQAKTSLESYKDSASYRAAQKAELATAIDAGKKAIDSAADTDSISKAAAAAKTAIDSIKTDAQLSLEELNAAKSQAKASLESYKDSKSYRTAQKAELAAVIDAAKKAIDSAADADSISKAAAAAKTAIDSIKTDAQLSLEEDNAAKKVEEKMKKINDASSAADIADTLLKYLSLTDKEKENLDTETVQTFKDKVSNINHTDKDTGIQAEGIDWNIKLNVQTVSETAQTYKTISENIGAQISNGAILKMYELSLIDLITNNSVQPGSDGIIITMEIPDNMKGYAKLMVVHQKHDGTVEYIKDIDIKDGRMTFKLSSLSPVGIVGYNDSSTVNADNNTTANTHNITMNSVITGDNNVPFQYIALMIISIAGIGSVIFKRKRKSVK